MGLRHHLNRLFLNKKNIKALSIWSIAAFFYGYEFFLRASPSVMQTQLQKDFMLDAEGLGFIVSLYYWAYASMQVPAGMLIDRFGPKNILTMAAVICAVSILAFGLATEPIVAGVSRFMIGFGSAFAIIGTFKLAGNWFPSSQFAFFAGFTLTFGTIGATLANTPLEILVNCVGWRMSLFILCGIGLLNAFALWFFVKDHPSSQKLEAVEHSKKGENSGKVWKTFKGVILNPQSWYIGAFAAFIYIPITCFGELWGFPFIMKSCSYGGTKASFLISLIFIGITGGAPLFGWLSDSWKRRKIPLFIGTFGAFISISIAIYVPDLSFAFMAFLMIVLGVCLGSHMILFALIRENNPPNASAIASGFGNFVCMIVPGLFQYLIGVSLDFLNKGSMKSAEKLYSLSSFKISLLFIPIGLVLAAICLAFSRETYAQQVDKRHL
ncbi:MAG: MFS transporter [Proteobacteria bacterium]|nr:MFS transporter [Pseudomonadota bacterium]